MSNLQIEYVKVSSLKMYENNAKEHTKEQIKQIKKSIKEFGFNDPIAVWKDNEIIEGHGRFLACLELGIDEVPIIRLDHLTEEQRRIYMLVHNKLNMDTGFDLARLEAEIQNIAENMSVWGFDTEAIEIEDIEQYIDEPEEPIARELGEANNYVVLEFFTEDEWEQAQRILGLTRTQTGEENKNIRRHGIGRVIEGKAIPDRLEAPADEN